MRIDMTCGEIEPTCEARFSTGLSRVFGRVASPVFRPLRSSIYAVTTYLPRSSRLTAMAWMRGRLFCSCVFTRLVWSLRLLALASSDVASLRYMALVPCEPAVFGVLTAIYRRRR